MKTELLQRIEKKEAIVGVVGLGYVGLPLLLCYVENGFATIGFDIDARKVEMLGRGQSYINHIPAARIQSAVQSGRMTASTDFSAIAKCDAIIIAVPTPLSKNREPDLSFVESTCSTISQFLRKGQIVTLESTTYPGTTDEVMVPILESRGLKVDRDFFAAFSPEREDPSRADFTTATIPKVVGATSPDGLAVAAKLYQQVIATVVPVSSTRVAEASKLVENIFRSVNIALVNELKITFMTMGIDIWEVIEAAKTKPFGFMPFYPGPGLGGHCIPIDPFYLTWKAREYGVTTKFIELAGEVNTAMPDFVVQRAMEVLNERGRAMKGARVLLLGLAYKGNVDDDRESPTYHLMAKLEKNGAHVEYNDPFIPEIRVTREFPQYAGRKSVPIDSGFDLLLIATPHEQYRSIDFEKIGVPVLDTRNIMKGPSPLLHKS
jgi:UDP-N-acetyl-D-glucosamine dehydrogenase